MGGHRNRSTQRATQEHGLRRVCAAWDPQIAQERDALGAAHRGASFRGDAEGLGYWNLGRELAAGQDTNDDVDKKEKRIKEADGELSDAKSEILDQEQALSDAKELLGDALGALEELEASASRAKRLGRSVSRRGRTKLMPSRKHSQSSRMPELISNDSRKTVVPSPCDHRTCIWHPHCTTGTVFID